MMNLSFSDPDNLKVYRARLVLDVHRQILLAFQRRERESRLTRTEFANRLGVHKSVISRRLSGNSNLSLAIISDMARAMGFVPSFRLSAYDDLARPSSNYPLQFSRTQDAYYGSTQTDVAITNLSSS